MEQLKCKRCGWEWKPRVDNPARCPQCKSPYWNRERLVRSWAEVEQGGVSQTYRKVRIVHT